MSIALGMNQTPCAIKDFHLRAKAGSTPASIPPQRCTGAFVACRPAQPTPAASGDDGKQILRVPSILRSQFSPRSTDSPASSRGSSPNTGGPWRGVKIAPSSDMHGVQSDSQTFQIIGAAMEVHRRLHRGLFEAIYCDALAIEFSLREFHSNRTRDPNGIQRSRAQPPASSGLRLLRDVVVEVKADPRSRPRTRRSC